MSINLLLGFCLFWPPLLVKGQTQNVLRKIDNLLQQAKTSKANLLTATIWLKDVDKDFDVMNDVWCDWLDANEKPVRATVQADMARPSILVEIQVTAAEEEEEEKGGGTLKWYDYNHAIPTKKKETRSTHKKFVSPRREKKRQSIPLW